MNPLNPFAISGLLIALSYFPLMFFVYSNGTTKATKLYSAHLFATGTWGLGAFLIGSSYFNAHIDILWKYSYVAVLFIPVLFFHTTVELIQKPTKLLHFSYIQAIIFSLLALSGNLWNNYIVLFNSFYYFKGNILYIASFIIWLLIFILSMHKLTLSYINSLSRDKQIIYLIYVETFGFLGGISNFLPGLGINIYPIGNFIIPISSLFTTYAIFKHELMDIKVAIKKSLAYSILILLTALLYFCIIVLSERFIQGFWGYKSTTISVLTAFTIGIMFFPLHNYIQKIVDKIIFKRTTEEISKENELLRAEVLKTEKLKSVAILASGMAHEVRNPLTALKTFSEYLPNKLDDKEFLLKFSKIVGSEVDRIDSLVTQLLEFAKPSPVQLQKTNINKLIQETLDFLSNKFIDHKIQVMPQLTAECDEPILLDPSKIRQVFLNLILNSIEAMRGGGRLEIASGLSDARNDVIISITDTGCGVTKENLTHIFDPFFSTKDTGTGLGLPITYGIIKEHGGEIKVDSQVGTGTTFTIFLPTNKA